MNQIDPKYAYKTRREMRREKAFQIAMRVAVVAMIIIATLIYIRYGC